MSDYINSSDSLGSPGDPRLHALHSDWLLHSRSFEQTEAEHHERLNRERASYDTHVARKSRQADLIENIELDRLRRLRQERSTLSDECRAAHDVAAKAFSELLLEYVAGESSVEDLYAIAPLPEAVAAERAGIPIAGRIDDRLLKVVKFAGMIGCLLLGAVGMGALLLHIPPRSLFHSPMLPVALGLACVLVGGVYLIAAPAGRRLGALTASRPDDPATGKVRIGVVVLVATLVLIVALVDAKALSAINSARALIDPNSAAPFWLTFLIAAALSAAYVLGTALHAFHEGFAAEASIRIQAEQDKHKAAHRAKCRTSLEVGQACEALNAVDLLEARRAALDEEIKTVERQLKESLNDAFADLPTPPELSDAAKKELRTHDQQARFAALKLNAYRATRKPERETESDPKGGAA